MKIPIENLYYLLCYAWRHTEERDAIPTGSAGRLETVLDLLGKVLAEGAFRLIQQGLDRGYRETGRDLSGIRGKLDLGETIKRALQVQGKAHCLFDELSHDVLHNRILRSTLYSLMRIPTLDPQVRRDVHLAYSRLGGIEIINLNRLAFRQVQLDQNRRFYYFLMAICELVHEHILPGGDGEEIAFRDFREEDATMWALFEEFVAEFYHREQSVFDVASQVVIPWSEVSAPKESDLSYIPSMRADLVLHSQTKRIILDTKFYQESFSGQYGVYKLHSGNLYQILCYLRNQQARYPYGPRYEGILLYPVVDHEIGADVNIEGFRIQALGINLNQHWKEIHKDMLRVLYSDSAS